MGRPATITYEQVAAIAGAMRDAGGNPSTRLVRERLGNMGNTGTINRLLQRWRSEQEDAAAATVLPAALQRAIMAFLEEELKRTRAELEGELAHYRQEMADLAAENERQLEAFEAQAGDLAALEGERAAVEGRAAQLAGDLDTARDNAARERAAAEAARVELAKAQLRLEALPRLEQQLGELGRKLEQERKVRVDAEQCAAVLTAQRADQESRIDDCKMALTHAHADTVRAQERAQHLTSLLDRERERRIEAEQAIAVLRVQHAELNNRYEESNATANCSDEPAVQVGMTSGSRAD